MKNERKEGQEEGLVKEKDARTNSVPPFRYLTFNHPTEKHLLVIGQRGESGAKREARKQQ